MTLLYTPTSAQDINQAVEFEDLGFTQRLNVGARAAAMAGAYVAAGDDVYSLIYNPAGLARVRRIDASLGFQYATNGVKNIFYGNSNETESSSMTLDALAAAYPLPTYRGSLVVAFGVCRVMSAQLDILYRGFNAGTDPETPTFDDYRLQQSGSVYSYTLGGGIDLSPQISVGVSGFIMDGKIDSLTQFSYEFQPPLHDGDLRIASLRDDAEADLDGYGLMVGGQYHLHRLLHLGLAFTFPISMSLHGQGVAQTAFYFFNDTTEVYTEDYPVEAEYTIPFRVDAGLSFTLPYLVLNLDAGYSDWRQAKVSGVALKDENLNAVFRQTLDVRVGGEYLVPWWSLRLRAGYARTPYALAYLQTDRIVGRAIKKADVETERQTFAAGLGFLLDRVLTIDASYEYQMGKRTTATLVDERAYQRVVLTGSYRF